MIVKQKDLSKIRKKFRDKKIAFGTGTFDLIHPGHIIFFKDCKKLGDIVVIGVGSDYDIKVNKSPDRPILNQGARLFIIDSLKPVDFCFITGNMKSKQKPLGLMKKILRSLRPDVWVVNEDAFDIPTREKIAAEVGVKIKVLPRHCPKKFQGISTTQIIGKIQGAIKQGERDENCAL